jgi:cytochrome c oxidase subunit II
MTLRWLMSGASDQHSLLPAGPQAQAIAHLFWVYMALLTVVAILVIATVVMAIWRRRSRFVVREEPALADDELEPHVTPAITLRRLDPAHEDKSRRRIVIASAITLLALFVLLGESVATSNALDARTPADALELQINAKQWWWEIRYLDAQASRGFVTANELHIPVGRSVRLQLMASDVIHSFWAPNLQGKRDLIPGHVNTLLLQADRPGRFRAQCAEFCGGPHAQMALWIVAEQPTEFEAWSAHQRQSAQEPKTELGRAGRDVFMRAPCATCHAINGTEAQSSVGPDLTHFASRIGIGAASFPNRRGYLGGWMVGAQGMKPGCRMPNIEIGADDLQALLTFMEGLR